MDKEIFDIIAKEKERQINGLELIASENYVSQDVLSAMGSILTITDFMEVVNSLTK